MSREDEWPVRQLRMGRMEAFSDGVFAIAITLLVLEITVPEGSDSDLLRAVLDQWPSYLAYVVSFATVGAIWLAHTAMSEYLHHGDVWLLRINLLLLLLVSFLPFPSRLLAGSIGNPDAAKVAATVYGLTLLGSALAMSALWRHARSRNLVRPDAGDEEVVALTRKLTPGLAGYVVMIALGLFLPVVATVGYLLIAVFFIVPIHRMRRSAAVRAEGG
ncbi:TMEM175 family protein [Intrasporangium sp.]|uniref:TMEM175 family protein n=1 Tax=Intrasporangium sp. TaxID=1925024 RepID=UPI0033655B54